MPSRNAMDMDGGEPLPGTLSRTALKRRLFLKCDLDGDGVLKKNEMLLMAKMVGFDGSHQEWDEEYVKLCREQGVNPASGVPSSAVARLLDDDSDDGCYCTDAEIEQLLGIAPEDARHAVSTSNQAQPGITKDRAADLASKAEEHTQGKSGAAKARGTGRVTSRPKVRPLLSSGLSLRELASSNPAVLGHERRRRGRGLIGGNCRVFFSGAGPQTPDDLLREAFEEWGDVRTLRIFRSADGRSRGSGVVVYVSAESAFEAVDAGCVLVDGWTLQLEEDNEMLKRGDESPGSWGTAPSTAPSDIGGNRVFFSGADISTPGNVIRDTFEARGPLRSFVLFRHPDGCSRGMGVATFRRSMDAARVLRGRSIRVLGRPLRLQEDTSQFERQPLEARGPGPVRSQRRLARPAPYPSSPDDSEEILEQEYDTDPRRSVIFRNVPFEITDVYLRRLFEKMGPVTNFEVLTLPDGRSRGTGVVEYATSNSALRAYNNLHGEIVGGRPMIVDEILIEDVDD